MKTFRGKLFLLEMILKFTKKQNKAEKSDEPSKASGTGMKINSSIVEMAKGFTVKRLVSMVPMLGIDPLTKEEILEMNVKLNKIKKK